MLFVLKDKLCLYHQALSFCFIVRDITNIMLDAMCRDVQRPPTLLNKAPKEREEMDENKSKKLYEDEYAQKTGLVSTALSFSDEQKKEVRYSRQANVPALAMEEVAPLAVSDAAMLAPEEVFSGKGDIKEETELTKVDRERRRAKKKRQFKVPRPQLFSKWKKKLAVKRRNIYAEKSHNWRR
ncbi:hypothetical protein SASPL_118048 [Salvia splendens]|uniref:Uncharacterized protein n=1 Tax=Salvia splendens TaxID=180675 RepID=A0A8X8XZ07_SALSN|nr:hypothetical protein SASPL_118048 [Salvia splendens]